MWKSFDVIIELFAWPLHSISTDIYIEFPKKKESTDIYQVKMNKSMDQAGRSMWLDEVIGFVYIYWNYDWYAHADASETSNISRLSIWNNAM